jgi:beta-mannosidase
MTQPALITQPLIGPWHFRQTPGAPSPSSAGLPTGAPNPSSARPPAPDTPEWLPATVPGAAHTDLLALGRIPDPFAGDNERRVAWVAEADWEYRKQFDASPDLLARPHVELVCDGLDTLATVTLNGHELGRTDNMFRQHRWDVRPLLRPEGNELRIAFASPARYAAQKEAERPLPRPTHSLPGGPHIRKAPCQFGWDWGPQLPPVGIWKDIRLEGYATRLADVHLRQQHENGGVTVTARIAVEGWAPGLTATLILTAPDGATQTVSGALPAPADNLLTLQVDNPQLWWPNGMGAQPLYQVDVTLVAASFSLPQPGQANGQAEARPYETLDHRAYQLGLRTIQLRQQPDQWGRSFEFVVNGRPFFAKGSNWIPADSFPTRITEPYLDTLIRAAVDTHHNMLRVWGGGLYEEELFYDLCDRYGILVWQEFIFSCSIYPLDDPAFVENVRVEAVENMRRIRHRASLCLWCGNNEMEWGWHDWGWNKPELRDLKAAYDRFFHHTLPAWVAAEDPDTAYWPSSPSSYDPSLGDTPFKEPNGQIQGDAHYWDVWHGRKPFTAYRNQYPRFMSEFGFQALPPLDTIRTYAEPADWNMTSYIMDQHQKNDSGNSLMVGQMLDTFRMPKDFESLVYLSMVLQAEGIRYGVEHWRRHTDRVAGTLYWQLNDCWPVASWSSLDYFGRWKALHYAAKRFYAPIMLSIEDAPPCQTIYVSNDSYAPWQGEVRWRLTTLGGKELASGASPVSVGPRSTTRVDPLDFARFLDVDTRRELAFTAELWQGEARVAMNTAYFVPTKHLSLADPQLRAELREEAGQLAIDLTAASLARLVEVHLDGADAIFSDNYFDLPAGATVTVTTRMPAGGSLTKARAALKLRSVYDTYNR